MVMGNNNNEKSFLSDQINNQNQTFVSEQLREDDMVTNIKQASQTANTNSEILISDQSKYHEMEAKTIKQRRKESKGKRIQKLIFQRTIRVIKVSIINLLLRKFMA